MDWTAVLPADVPEDLLTQVLRDVEGRNWSCESSRGEEQVVLTVSGAENREELEACLSTLVFAEVSPLLSRGDYRRLSRRRHFMGWMVRALGLLAAMAAAIPVLGFLAPPKVTVGIPDQIRVAVAGELAEGSARVVRFQRRPVLVVHLEAERYFALGATCSYTEDCQLEWSDVRQQIVCPCHGDAFDIYGNVLQGPASIPLRRYRIERVGNELFLDHGD